MSDYYDRCRAKRGRSGVTLTHEGHLFLQHANMVLEAADEAARLPFNKRSTVAGTLELAASYTVLGWLLPASLPGQVPAAPS